MFCNFLTKSGGFIKTNIDQLHSTAEGYDLVIFEFNSLAPFALFARCGHFPRLIES